ncbi:synaptonemal complex central element protein 3 [Bombina bombina]|uniref:synaptonemal complex central element protein 3 n=1 Tax=Bombina bombina TaxID=8345 RepID=UPI00235B0F38|nr:synaptonemal complex central element protein 3 [Bombina bombina]
MAEPEPSAHSYESSSKMLKDLNKDMERLLEEMEKISVQASWMAYDMVVIRTNPALSGATKRLEDAFLKCKEEVTNKWQAMLDESKEQT